MSRENETAWPIVARAPTVVNGRFEINDRIHRLFAATGEAPNVSGLSEVQQQQTKMFVQGSAHTLTTAPNLRQLPDR
jgi:hypothetical protein